jgi:plasmid maintenance system antidote protein VapI
MTHDKTPPALDRLGAFLENEFRLRGWKHAEAARHIGVTKSAIGKIVRGEVRAMYETLAKFAHGFAAHPVEQSHLTMEQYLSIILDLDGRNVPDSSIDDREIRQLIQMMRTSPEAPVLIDVLERMPPDLRRQVLQTAQALLLQHETGNGQAPRKS